MISLLGFVVCLQAHGRCFVLEGNVPLPIKNWKFSMDIKMETIDIPIISTIVKFNMSRDRIEASGVMLNVATLEKFVGDII